jgi:hypothetical protein
MGSQTVLGKQSIPYSPLQRSLQWRIDGIEHFLGVLASVDAFVVVLAFSPGPFFALAWSAEVVGSTARLFRVIDPRPMATATRSTRGPIMLRLDRFMSPSRHR